jgi:hypothetical protein
MTDRRLDPPPTDPDAMVWWERREIAEGHAESAQALITRARAESDSDRAQAMRLEANTEAVLAVYHENRAAAECAELVGQRQEELAKTLRDHAQAVGKHSGSMSDHQAGLLSHTEAMNRLIKAMAAHPDALWNALRTTRR